MESIESLNLMTVGELIEALRKMPNQYNVVLLHEEGEEFLIPANVNAADRDKIVYLG